MNKHLAFFYTALKNLQEHAPSSLPEAQNMMVASLKEALEQEKANTQEMVRFWAGIATVAVLGKKNMPVDFILNDLAHFMETRVGDPRAQKVVDEINNLLGGRKHCRRDRKAYDYDYD